jgi:hypothetical protein
MALRVRVTVLLEDGGQHTVCIDRDGANNPRLHWDEAAAGIEAALPLVVDAVAAVYGRTQPAVPRSKLAQGGA